MCRLVPASDVNWLAVWLSIRLASQVTRKTEISIATIDRSADTTSAPRLSRSSRMRLAMRSASCVWAATPDPSPGLHFGTNQTGLRPPPSTTRRKFSTARWTCLSGSLTSSATSSPALPPGGS
jgi:hypothetical protein